MLSYPAARIIDRRSDRIGKESRRLSSTPAATPPAGLAGVRRGREPNIYVDVLVKIIFSNKLS
jgi:hypothetical protein